MHGGLAGHHAGAQRLLDRVEYREGDQDQAVLQGPDREALAIGGGVHVQGWCGILIFDKYTYLASF